MMALEEGCKAVKAKLAVNGSPTRMWIELVSIIHIFVVIH